MRIENQAGRQLSVAATWKDKKTGELIIRVDTDDVASESWQDGYEQALGAS